MEGFAHWAKGEHWSLPASFSESSTSTAAKSSETQESPCFFLVIPPFPPIKSKSGKLLFFLLQVPSQSPETELRAPYLFPHLLNIFTLCYSLEGPVAA